MNYAEIKNCDIANGPGVRISLFVSGCTHHCPGCFNREAWDFHYGEPFTQQTIDESLKLLEPRYLEVWGKFLPRGGISIDPYTNYGKPGTKFEELAWQRFSQHDLVAMDKVDNR